MEVKIYTQGCPDEPKFVVVFARYDGKWLYARHRERETFEVPGGHIEPGETPLEAAKRELREESGALDFEITHMYGYSYGSCGEVFFAEVRTLGELPDSEIAEVREFERMPENLTYPQIQPALWRETQLWLSLQTSADELWDVYDGGRNLTGRVHRRGDTLEPGDYHLAVHVWIVNSRGEILIDRRSLQKGFGGMWETTGGSAVAGEDSLTATLRETEEELGLKLDPERGECVLQLKRQNDFCDIWLFRQDFDIAEVRLNPEETIEVKWVDIGEIRNMISAGDFLAHRYHDELFAIIYAA